MNQTSRKMVMIMTILTMIALFLPQFYYFKLTRLKTQSKIGAYEGMGMFITLFLALSILMLVVLYINKCWSPYVLLLISGVSIAAMIMVDSYSIGHLPFPTESYSRLSFGPAAWFWFALMFCVAIKSMESCENQTLAGILAVVPVILIFLLLFFHRLDGLGVIKEYQNVKNLYWKNLYTHIWISIGVLAASMVIGIPLGYLVNKSRIADRIVFSVINITETIPGISFIAILMIPFAYLSARYPALRVYGIKQFGAGPAVIALVLYGLFPIIHNTRAAFKGIDAQYVETAKAMGMDRSRIFLKILVPIAFPQILNGIRIALVYTITGVTLAAFIGGGGLGTYMVKTESLDTVLLGLVPVVIMTFCADKGIRFLAKRISHMGVLQDD